MHCWSEFRTSQTGRAALRTFEATVAIVTGAASGIGRALAEELAQCGSDVVWADREHNLTNQKQLRKLQAR
jgi:NAD(P)-dependent dehydrogenase (short-subunit alcohol dehydrogenase family)